MNVSGVTQPEWILNRRWGGEEQVRGGSITRGEQGAPAPARGCLAKFKLNQIFISRYLFQILISRYLFQILISRFPDIYYQGGAGGPCPARGCLAKFKLNQIL